MSDDQVDPVLVADMIAVTASWILAAHALRHRDFPGVIQHLAPGHLTSQELHDRAYEMSIVGSALCGAELARINGHPVGKPAGPLGYRLSPAGPHGWDDTSVNQVCAMQCITAAANDQKDTVAALIAAHLNPDDPAQLGSRAGLMYDLLKAYVSMTES